MKRQRRALGINIECQVPVKIQEGRERIMAISWSEDLKVGFNIIDEQHKELFVRIDALLTAMSKGKGRDEVCKTLEFLEKYVVYHFDEEEKIQKKSNYAGYERQKVQHEQFKSQISTLKQKMMETGINSALVIETQREMSSWWVSHITNMDKEFGKFLKEKNYLEP